MGNYFIYITSNPAKTVLYIGRLETRKGVYNLAKAIPEVVKKIPDVRFVFLGKDSRGVFREKSMKKAPHSAFKIEYENARRLARDL